jgi:hypothetical protein
VRPSERCRPTPARSTSASRSRVPRSLVSVPGERPLRDPVPRDRVSHRDGFHHRPTRAKEVRATSRPRLGPRPVISTFGIPRDSVDPADGRWRTQPPARPRHDDDVLPRVAAARASPAETPGAHARPTNVREWTHGTTARAVRTVWHRVPSGLVQMGAAWPRPVAAAAATSSRFAPKALAQATALRRRGPRPTGTGPAVFPSRTGAG